MSDIPHSWFVAKWPQHVVPGDAAKGRTLCRLYRDELIEAGALARLGHQLIVFGKPYAKWLGKRAASVSNYTCNANREERA